MEAVKFLFLWIKWHDTVTYRYKLGLQSSSEVVSDVDDLPAKLLLAASAVYAELQFSLIRKYWES